MEVTSLPHNSSSRARQERGTCVVADDPCRLVSWGRGEAGGSEGPAPGQWRVSGSGHQGSGGSRAPGTRAVGGSRAPANCVNLKTSLPLVLSF